MGRWSFIGMPLLLISLVVMARSYDDACESINKKGCLFEAPWVAKKPKIEQPILIMPWPGADGHQLSLQADLRYTATYHGLPLAFPVLGIGMLASGDLYYGISPYLSAHAGVSERAWMNWNGRVVGGEVGLSYQHHRYGVSLSVAAHSARNQHRSPQSRGLPKGVPGLDGLTDFDSSSQVKLRSRFALGNKNAIDIAASIGPIQLLPGNALGFNTLKQKALSLGFEHGPVGGRVIGRVMDPQTAKPRISSDHHWKSIDLDVTWRLPWQGSLSFGTRNVWTSAPAVKSPRDVEPDQSRIPYVQYHQDL